MNTLAMILVPVATLVLGLLIGIWLARSMGRQALDAQFRVLATDILDQTTRRFSEQSQSQIGTLLDPLRARLTEFQDRVETLYRDEGEKRIQLRLQVEQLAALNAAISEDARNLTDALRGSNKMQGNWGEQILERILETAGLVPEVHYVTQDARQNGEGRRVQPDVVILLPEERRIVVDSKVSLLDYQAACDATTDDERRAALKRHIQSIRTHIRGLAEKQYPSAYGAAFDCVVMFVPVEPAFLMAITEDAQLAEDAWRDNILLVSPSSLLFVLRSVAFLWRQDTQAKKTGEIVERGRLLYEKLNGFVTDLERVGTALDGARDAYDSAFGKLKHGKGNLLRQAQQLEALGIPRPKKPAVSLAGTIEDEEEHDSIDVEPVEPIAEGLAPRQLGGPRA